MVMCLDPCTLFFLVFPFDSRTFEASNRFVVMVPQTSTVANGKSASFPARASHARGAAIRPGQTTLCVDPSPGVPWTLVLLALAVLSAGVEAAELSVSGSFSVHVARAVANPHSDFDGSFSVNCSDRQWIIRSKRSDQATDYEEDGCDGKCVYSLTSLESWIKNRSAKGMKAGANSAEGQVTPGTIPFNSPDINRVLWLLYASSCYLSETPVKRLPSILSYSARHAYLYYPEQPAEWQTTGTSPLFPTFIVLYDDGRLRTWADQDAGFMTGPPIQRKWAAPYDKGFTNAVLAVESFYEGGGHRVPKSATFSVYMPKPEGTNANDLNLSSAFAIRASDMSFRTSVTNFRPEVKGSAFIADRRFERDKNPVYVVSYLADKKWLSDEELRQRPEFVKMRQEQAIRISASRAATAILPKHSQAATRSTRWIVLSILAMTTMLGLVIMFTKSRRKANPR
jgi:hypothetical protein